MKTMAQLSLKGRKEPFLTGKLPFKDRHNHKPLLNNRLIVDNAENVEMAVDMAHVLNAWNALHQELKLLHLNQGSNSPSRDRNNHNVRKDQLHSHSSKCRDQKGCNKVYNLQEVLRAGVVKAAEDPKDQDPAVVEEVNQPS